MPFTDIRHSALNQSLHFSKSRQQLQGKGVYSAALTGRSARDTLNTALKNNGAKNVKDVESVRDSLENVTKSLPDRLKKKYEEDINGGSPFNQFVFPSYNEWAEQQRASGREPNEQLFRIQKADAWSDHYEKVDQNSKYQGVGGFFKGVGDAFKAAGPLALAQVADVFGKVIPGANVVTDELQGVLNPDHQKLAFDEVGGPFGAILHGAVGAASEVAGGSYGLSGGLTDAAAHVLPPSSTLTNWQDEDAQQGGGLRRKRVKRPRKPVKVRAL